MFLFRRAVTSIRRDGDRVREAVLDGEEQIAAPVVVNAAGPWSSRIDKMAGIDADFTVRLRPLRQEVHHVRPPRSFTALSPPGICLADMDLGTYMRPEAGAGSW